MPIELLRFSGLILNTDLIVRTPSKRRVMAAHSDESLLMSTKPSSSVEDVAELIQRTVDLSGSVEIHPLHGSVLGQQHCFQVSTRAGSTYFACRSDEERREWMHQYVILRSVCSPVFYSDFVKCFSTRCHISMSCLCYKHDVPLSVHLSVTLVDCDHIAQQKMEIGAWQDRIVSWLPAYRSRSGLWYPVIQNSAEEDNCGMEKCGVFHLGGNSESSGSHVTLF